MTKQKALEIIKAALPNLPEPSVLGALCTLMVDEVSSTPVPAKPAPQGKSHGKRRK